MKEVVVFVMLMSGCVPKQVEREVCYHVAETKFWDVVEECKRNGQNFEECELGHAERQLKREQEACR